MTRGPSFRRRLRLAATVLALGLLTPSLAHADPITATIVAFVNVIGGATIAAAVGNFLIAYGAVIYSTAASWALSKVSGSKAAAARDRQASVATLSVGEVPREMIVGEAGTGGSLADGYYFGGTNGTDWNVLVIALADHRCHGLTGFYVNDTFVAYTGDGNVPGYNNQLRVYWRAGTASDAALPADLSGLGPATATGAMQGIARAIVAYKADAPDAKNPTWTTGRPSFLWVVKGLRCYDPRKDDTVTGGSGPHRWTDPETWEWTDNAEICRYNYSRGTFFLDQVEDPSALMVGRGLSVYEAPLERVFAAANLCDEVVSVTNATTGVVTTEPRYRVGGVIAADQTFDAVEQLFADAMAGHVIQPEGGVAVEPGQARTPVFAITDDDLVTTTTVQWSDFVSDSDRINSVVVSYVEPDQKWAMTTAGVLRDLTDLAQDRGPKETNLPLTLVRHRSQALRIGEIRRRGARLERRGVFTLPPTFAGLEEGDWVTYTSARRTKGLPVTMRVTKYQLNEAWQNTVALEETSSTVYGIGAPAVVPPNLPVVIPVGALALGGVTATAILLSGTDGSALPAVQFTWTAPVDAAITSIRAEVRMSGETAVTPTTTTEVNEGLLNVTGGVPSAGTIEVRLVPLGAAGRAITPSAWIALTTGSFIVPTDPGPPDTVPPAAPSALSYESSLGTIFLHWTDPADLDVDKVEIWRSATNDRAAAVKLATVASLPSGGNGWAHSGLLSGVTGYYWVRAIDKSGNVSVWSSDETHGLAATTDKVGFDDFPADLEAIGVVSVLPTVSGYTGPKTVRLTTNGKIYRLVSGDWVAGVAAGDITGQLSDSQISDLDAAKIAGQITATQITNGAISTPKLAAGSVITSKLAAGAVTANEVAAGTLTGDRLVAGTISSAYIASGAILTDRLAANAVTAAKIASGTITADRIVANEIDTQYIKNGALSNAGIVDLPQSTLISNNVGTYTNVSGSGVTFEVRNSGGSYTSVIFLFYLEGQNQSMVDDVGMYGDIVMSGAGISGVATLTGAAILVQPGNPANFCVPLLYRTSASGFITAVAGAASNGPTPKLLYVTRCKIVPIAIFKS